MTLTAAELEALVERACTAAVERAFQRQAGATGAFGGLTGSTYTGSPDRG